MTSPEPVEPPRSEASPLGRPRARAPRKDPGRGAPGAWVLLAAWGPCGFSPIAPGTVGTLGAVPLAWVLSRLGWPTYLLATALLLALGVVAAGRAGRYWGVVDASPIVVDEVVGYLVAVAGLPFSWPVAVAAFVLFRFFDVLKPWPASAFDRIKNGFGVVMADLAAGAFAWGALRGLELLGVLP